MKSRCPGDRTLFLLQQGEGDLSHHAHLRACLRCAARYQRMARDLEGIGRALREAPEPEIRRRVPAGWPRAAVVAAALVTMVAIVGIEAWMWRESRSWLRPPPSVADSDARPFLEAVSAVLSPAGEAGAPTLVMLSPSADPLPALEDAWADGWDEDALVNDGMEIGWPFTDG